MSNVAEMIGQYVMVRDRIKAMRDDFKKEVAPFEQLLDEIGGALLDAINKSGSDSIASKVHGTAYKTIKTSVSLESPDEFKRHVIGTGSYELLDWKANATAVKAFVEEHSDLPPGVKMTQTVEIGVRRGKSE